MRRRTTNSPWKASFPGGVCFIACAGRRALYRSCQSAGNLWKGYSLKDLGNGFLYYIIMTTQTPGGLGPPCCMGIGLGDSVPADFHEEKIGTFSGSPGAKLPAAFLLPFVAEDKRKWPRSRYLFWVGLRSLCADKPQQKSGLSATFFLHTKKEGKDVPRGFPPWNPQAACRFSW